MTGPALCSLSAKQDVLAVVKKNIKIAHEIKS